MKWNDLFLCIQIQKKLIYFKYVNYVLAANADYTKIQQKNKIS